MNVASYFQTLPVYIVAFVASTFFPLKAGAVTQTSVTAIAEANVRDPQGAQQDPFTDRRSLRREHLPDPNNSGGAIEASASASVDLVDSNATASAAANAQIGKIGVSMSGIGRGAPRGRVFPNSFPSGGRAGSSGFARAQWLDTITLSSASRGNAVRAVYNVFLDGELVGLAFGPEASVSMEFLLENPDQSRLQIPNNIRAIVNKTATDDIVEDVPGGFQVTLSPPAGPFTIGLKMTIQGNAKTDNFDEEKWDDHTFGYVGEVGQSLTWGGLVGVFDLFTGEELNDWTMTSESGFDYSKPFGVPEPASIALLGVALLPLLLERRRLKCA